MNFTDDILDAAAGEVIEGVVILDSRPVGGDDHSPHGSDPTTSGLILSWAEAKDLFDVADDGGTRHVVLLWTSAREFWFDRAAYETHYVAKARIDDPHVPTEVDYRARTWA
jgi:hypothetical protein